MTKPALPRFNNIQVTILSRLAFFNVSFIIVGGQALSFHGIQRPTKDLDILIDTSRSNAKRVYSFLSELGVPPTTQQIQQPKQRYSIADEVDILTSVDGKRFKSLVKNAVKYKGLFFVSLQDLYEIKKAHGAFQDCQAIDAFLNNRTIK